VPPVFIIATELHSRDAAWKQALAQLNDVRVASARVLGFDPDLRLASIPAHPGDAAPAESLLGVIRDAAQGESREIFVLPAALDFSLWQREALGQLLGEARREHPSIAVHHDDVDLGHPLLVSAFADRIGRAIADANAPAQRCGLILAPGGNGDPASRAQSYRLMRLLWEELGLARAEVAFLRHAQPFLAHVLERCARENILWVVVSQAQWNVEHAEYAKVMLANFRRAHPQAEDWHFIEPPGAHPALNAWLAQRIVRLWGEKRGRETARMPSARNAAPASGEIWSIGGGIIGRVPDRDAMHDTLARILPPEKPERVLVKVTWHGYAAGTYTDPAALDLLLGALPAPAIVLEGHTSSRNLGGANFDWETESRENRAWIRQQEAEYLRRTGLAEVLARHRAQYVNVTEAWWDEECACRCEIERAVAERGIALHHSELVAFVPKVLLQFRGSPMISFAKMKGPTRLGISNMFGLIPAPLRSSWHGPNITWFARVCCDVAKVYGALFDLCGVVEGMFTSVRWSRQGLYRSRWGNYDLIANAACITASRGLAPADILASRLQGQDVSRSAFFDVVRDELGWDREAAEQNLPEAAATLFL
jgi:sirohydrochlorin ferrochelatase